MKLSSSDQNCYIVQKNSWWSKLLFLDLRRHVSDKQGHWRSLNTNRWRITNSAKNNWFQRPLPTVDIWFQWLDLFLFLKNGEIIRLCFSVFNQQAFKDNCFEFVKEIENDMTYSEARDHCENQNGSLINQNRLLDLKNVWKIFTVWSI